MQVALQGNGVSCFRGSPPKIPEVIIPEDIILGVASAFRVEFNRAFAIIRDIARGRDLKKFLDVIVGLWVLSILGSWCSFPTLFYIGFILVHTVPVIYEKYDAQIDAFAERAEAEFKKQYAVFDAKKEIQDCPLESQNTTNLADDAISLVFGKESRGIMRRMGFGD